MRELGEVASWMLLASALVLLLALGLFELGVWLAPQAVRVRRLRRARVLRVCVFSA